MNRPTRTSTLRRAGLALLVVALGVVSAAPTAQAAASPPDPVIDARATGGANVIRASWTAAPSGEPATSFVVVLHRVGTAPGAVASQPIVVLAPTTTALFTSVPAGTYDVRIYAKNAYPGPDSYVTVPNVKVTAPSAPGAPAPVIRVPDPKRPYGSWGELVTRELQFLTGCGRLGPAIGNAQMVPIRDAIFVRPDLDRRYAAHVAARYQFLVNAPAFGLAPADTNRNQKLEAAELTAAQARAAQLGADDTRWDRRVDFVRSAAVSAEAVDGPAYRLYRAYFGRAPELRGLCYWSNRLRSGRSLASVSDAFVQSSEFVRTYGRYQVDGGTGTTGPDKFLALIYRNVLGREADAAGSAYWVRQLRGGQLGPADVMVQFSGSSEFKAKNALRVGATVGYVHLLGRMPTAAELADIEFYKRRFPISPSLAGTTADAELYVAIIESAEYRARLR